MMKKMPEKKSNNLKNELDTFIVDWNNKFPIDRWWRVKHNIPFGSIEHKKANFIQMFLEYEEDKLINQMQEKSTDPEISEFSLQDEVLTKQEIDDDFENLELEKYNDKE